LISGVISLIALAVARHIPGRRIGALEDELARRHLEPRPETVNPGEAPSDGAPKSEALGRCSGAQLDEMTAAGMSAPAIQRACAEP
jgi:hypothetical protein